MAWGDGKLRGPENLRASKPPMPPGGVRGALKLTVPEDEFRVVTGGRVASCTLVGLNIRRRATPAGSVPMCRRLARAFAREGKTSQGTAAFVP